MTECDQWLCPKLPRNCVFSDLADYCARRDRRWLWLSVPLGGWAVGVGVKAMALLPLLATGDHLWP